MTNSSTGTGKAAATGGTRKAMRPRDAATLVIADFASGPARILMGQRRKDQVFMPGKYVFPGGRVDNCDRGVATVHDLRSSEIAKLLMDMKGVPSVTRARALALAAVRETFEETGIMIGASARGAGAPHPNRSAGSWKDFCGHGFLPRLDALTFFARAITPPGRPRRYDTRFFCVDAAAINHRIKTRDCEFLGLHWLTLEETQDFDLPAITRVILEDFADALARGGLPGKSDPVPFYFSRNGSFHRQLLVPASS